MFCRKATVKKIANCVIIEQMVSIFEQFLRNLKQLKNLRPQMSLELTFNQIFCLRIKEQLSRRT